MRKRLSSPRFRRRLAWISSVALLAALVAAAITFLPGSKPPREVFTKEAPKVYKEPTGVSLDSHGRAEVLTAASDFVKTAVRRRNVDASWQMAAPVMRQGLTRRQWATGNIPVVPYPAVAIRDWQIDWSYRNDVALDLVLVPKTGSQLVPKSFMIELKRFGGAVHHRWLVASWAPKGVSESLVVGRSNAEVPKSTSLSGRWLLLPLVLLLSVIIVLPIFLGVRERVHLARAERVHRRSTNG